MHDTSLVVRPSTHANPIRKWADVLTFGHATPVLREGEKAIGVSHAAALLHVIRGNTEAAGVGSVLGLVSATGGIVRGGVPIDLAMNVVADLAGVLLAKSEWGVTARNVGNCSMAIFTKRQVEEFFGVKAAAGVHGDEPEADDGEDAILAFGKTL